MPLLLQPRLLRVLQERRVTPLGGTPVAVDFALTSATHRDLRQAVAQGHFRSDLYYRINGYGVRLPALRERQDFDALVEHLLERCEGGGAPIAPDLMQAMRDYEWPGNLRQLASVLQTACALRDPREEPRIDWSHLAEDLREAMGAATTPVQPMPTQDVQAPQESAAPPALAATGPLRQLTEQAIRQALAQTQGNVAEAARRLSISRQTIYRALHRASCPEERSATG